MQATCHLRTYLTIRNRLIDFYYEPGSTLSPTKIADELSVSMTPVREVLMKLSAQGYAELRAGKGFFVHRPDVGFITERYEIIGALTGRAITNLCQVGQEAVCQRIVRDISQRLDSLNDLALNPDACHGFFEGTHELIGRASGNSIIASALFFASSQTSYYRKIDFETRTDLKDDIDDTRLILDRLSVSDYVSAIGVVQQMIARRIDAVPKVIDRMMLSLLKKFSQQSDHRPTTFDVEIAHCSRHKIERLRTVQ